MTKAMTKSQQEYARGRVENVYRARAAAIREQHALTPRFIKNEEKIELIRSGKASMKEEVRSDTYTRLFDSFDFSDFEDPRTITDEGQEMLDALNLEKQEIVDKIMLGSSSEAFAIINNL